MEHGMLFVLAIEDNPGDVALLRILVGKAADGAAITLECVPDLTAGMARLGAGGVDAVLLDLNLPDSSGLDSLRAIAAGFPAVPIVVLTGLDDDRTGLAAVNSGAEDYLVKGGITGDQLVHALRFAVQRHLALAALRSLTHVDELTDLLNRRGFLSLAARHLEIARRTGAAGALFFADLDRLKPINDGFGHAEGDRAIVAAAAVLRRAFRASDVLGRMGGDEFAVLATRLFPEPPDAVAARIQQGVRESNAAPGRPWRLSMSLGWARFSPDSMSTVEDLLVEADRRMYEAKTGAAGQGGVPPGERPTTRQYRSPPDPPRDTRS